MAHLDKESGKIILSEEDEQMFREVKSQFTPNGLKLTWSNKIMKSILKDTNLEHNYGK